MLSDRAVCGIGECRAIPQNRSSRVVKASDSRYRLQLTGIERRCRPLAARRQLGSDPVEAG